MSTKICIFGASVTWGEGDAEGGGWVARLQRYFKTGEDFDIIIYNLGISGDSTEDLLKRFKNECVARKPKIIIFAIGTNDSLYIRTKNYPNISLGKFQNNLLELINQAKSFSDKIVFVGLTKVDETKVMPIPWAKEKFYDNENIAKYNLTLEKAAREHGLPFINLLDLLNANDLDDGLHPNSDGHKKMFLRIKDFLLANRIV